MWFLRCIIFPIAILATKCAWDYRFDDKDNHFNIVYPDKNAVYFGMILPSNTTDMIVESESHPFATYFSIQIYEYGDLITSTFDYRDVDIVADLRDAHSPYIISSQLENDKRYFALFRIYGRGKPTVFPLRPPFPSRGVEGIRNLFTTIGKGGRRGKTVGLPLLWAGIPPHTYIDDIKYPLCDIDYDEQGNIYSNITRDINPKTHTVCDKNDVFLFMDAPAGSLTNADANYMIACVNAGVRYHISIQLPNIMCYPDFYGDYDVRYASLSVVSTTAPRPTVETYVLPCNTTQYSVDITIDDDVPFPGLLYRQILPNPDFTNSIANAKRICYDSGWNYDCIRVVMEEFYPKIERIHP